MSGKNWLERDPKDSPGLQRVTELYQAKEAERIADKARDDAWQVQLEAERKQRAERAALVEKVVSRILPQLEEIKNFANRTKTYPLGADIKKLAIPLEVVKVAETKAEKALDNVECPWADVELSYGFKGFVPIYAEWVDTEPVPGEYIGDREAVHQYGIKTMIRTHHTVAGDNTVVVSVQKQEVVTIPARLPGPGGFKMGWQPGEPARDEVKNTLVTVGNPHDEELIKKALFDAFHDPVYLGAIELPLRQEVISQPEPQASTGISGIVKGFLGLK